MTVASERQQGWHDFLKLCRAAKTTKQLDELFDCLMTFEERHALGLRVALIQELLSGQKTQREIAADLDISIAKITRGSNALKIITDRLKNFLKSMLT
jgi:TrpR family transcriptional regulator, trp operon repressor